MKLNEYPIQIANLQRQLLAQEQQVRRLKDTLATFDREIEGTIAFDPDLKNDAQRKAKRAELMATEDYQGLLLDLRSAQDTQAELEIDLEFLRSQFSVAKLEQREAIVSMELAVVQQAA